MTRAPVHVGIVPIERRLWGARLTNLRSSGVRGEEVVGTGTVGDGIDGQPDHDREGEEAQRGAAAGGRHRRGL